MQYLLIFCCSYRSRFSVHIDRCSVIMPVMMIDYIFLNYFTKQSKEEHRPRKRFKHKAAFTLQANWRSEAKRGEAKRQGRD